MRPELEWTDDNHAHGHKAHYHAYERSDDPSGRKWRLEVFSRHTDGPGGPDKRLGEFKMTSLADAKEIAQGLDGSARVVLVNVKP